MSNLPFPLPDCDQPATVWIEVYSPANGMAHGSLDASVYTCEEHGIEAASAIWAAKLTAYKASVAPGVGRRCGESFVFPTGNLGGQR